MEKNSTRHPTLINRLQDYSVPHLGVNLDTRGRLFYTDFILVTTSLARHPFHFEGCGPFLLTGTSDHTPDVKGIITIANVVLDSRHFHFLTRWKVEGQSPVVGGKGEKHALRVSQQTRAEQKQHFLSADSAESGANFQRTGQH